MQRINFRRERDLGKTLDASATFIKQNFIKIMKPTFIVVVIPLLLGSIIMSMGVKELYGDPNSFTQPDLLFSYMGNMFVSYGITMIAYILAYIMIIGYIKLYTEGVENITLSDLIPILKSKAPMLVLSSIALIVVSYIGFFLCALPGIYLSIVFFHFFAIAIIEDSSFGKTWSRCFYIIKDNWWSSFGLYIVTYLISLGIMMLLYIPIYAIMGMKIFEAASENNPEAIMQSMSNMAYMIPLYHVLGVVISLLFAVVSTFRYYSLVEKKEGTGERELINQM